MWAELYGSVQFVLPAGPFRSVGDAEGCRYLFWHTWTLLYFLSARMKLRSWLATVWLTVSANVQMLPQVKSSFSSSSSSCALPFSYFHAWLPWHLLQRNWQFSGTLGGALYYSVLSEKDVMKGRWCQFHPVVYWIYGTIISPLSIIVFILYPILPRSRRTTCLVTLLSGALVRGGGFNQWDGDPSAVMDSHIKRELNDTPISRLSQGRRRRQVKTASSGCRVNKDWLMTPHDDHRWGHTKQNGSIDQ